MARMIAEDREPDYRIAASVGVSLRTVQYWKKRRDVKARVQEIADEAATRLEAHYDRLEWLRERECCQMDLNSGNPITKRVALMRLREMGAL
jgi:hypothetical protein